MTNFYTAFSNKEATYGTDPAAGTQEIRTKQNNHIGKQEYEVSHDIEGGLEPTAKTLVRDYAEGNIITNPHLDKKFGRLLAMLFGKDTVSTVNIAVGNHIFTFLPKVTAAAPWPSFTMYKGNGIDNRNYTGFGVSGAKFELKQAALMLATFQTFSKKPSSASALKSLSAFSQQKRLSNAHVVTQTVGGSAVKLEDWAIDVQGPAQPAFKGGSLDTDSIDTRPAKVMFNGTIRFLDATRLDDFIAGTERAIVIKLDNGTNIASSNPQTNYSLQFDLPNLKFEDADVKINEQQRVVQVLNGEVVRDATDAYFKATLQDEILTSYSA